MRFWQGSMITSGFIAGVLFLISPGCEKASDKITEPALPVVVTLETVGISGTAAFSGGRIISAGSSPITARGVCWNLAGNPTLNDQKTVDGSGSGTFSSAVEGLSEGTSYFVRAYAVNAVGIAYGGQELFTTVTVPEVTTSEVTSITGSTAISGGKVIFCGGASVTSRGVCWSTKEYPTIADSKTRNGKNIGSFESVLTELVPLTVYYARAYATNSAGTGYGMQVRFSTH
jgi:hypothetical protein